MGDALSPCLICGATIFDSDTKDAPTWLNQYRVCKLIAVSSLEPDANGTVYLHDEEICISGVGYYKDSLLGHWIVPPEYNGRWDRDGYEFPAEHQIGVLRQSPHNSKYGFAFHEACWSILEVVFGSKPIPLLRLYDLCRSFPIPEDERAPDWGHAYGGLTEEHPETSLCKEANGYYTSHDRLCIFKVAKLNPCIIPELKDVSKQRRELPPPAWPSLGVHMKDAFTRLPEEICIAIACHLSTEDFYSLRLASSSFVSIFHYQQFWATRFARDGERGWLYEHRDWDRGLDWRWLYRRTGTSLRSSSMHNRERVWILARGIRRIVSAPFVMPSEPVRESLPAGDKYSWRYLVADHQAPCDIRPYDDFERGCRELFEGRAPLRNPVRCVSVYVAWLWDAVYVVGLRLVGDDGMVVAMGYLAEEVRVPLLGRNLTGFTAAVGSRGIKGIRCVFDEVRYSTWIGSIDEASETQRLSAISPLSALTTGFDVSSLRYSLVSLM